MHESILISGMNLYCWKAFKKFMSLFGNWLAWEVFDSIHSTPRWSESERTVWYLSWLQWNGLIEKLSVSFEYHWARMSCPGNDFFEREFHIKSWKRKNFFLKFETWRFSGIIENSTQSLALFMSHCNFSNSNESQILQSNLKINGKILLNLIHHRQLISFSFLHHKHLINRSS